MILHFLSDLAHNLLSPKNTSENRENHHPHPPKSSFAAATGEPRGLSSCSAETRCGGGRQKDQVTNKQELCWRNRTSPRRGPSPETPLDSSPQAPICHRPSSDRPIHINIVFFTNSRGRNKHNIAKFKGSQKISYKSRKTRILEKHCNRPQR